MGYWKRYDKVPDKDELRAEYKRSDFPGGFVSGKYAKRIYFLCLNSFQPQELYHRIKITIRNCRCKPSKVFIV